MQQNIKRVGWNVKYSVVIPVYNKAPYIARTLTSVLAQNFDDYEIIVVDDGSTDDSMQKLRQVQSPKIRIIRQENQGVAVARNTGILAAQGEYIAFLDADDAWLPEYLQTILYLLMLTTKNSQTS